MQQKNRGVTLVEILVVISVFSILITSVTSLFVSAMKEQRKSLDKAYLLNQGSFTSEYVSRALRMAQKDITGVCITKGFNYEITKGGNGIRFLNYRQGINCQEFYLDDGKIKVEKFDIAHDLTPSGLSIESLNFNISGQDQDDGLQGKVTFTWQLRSTGLDIQDLKLQTTISQRELDIKVRLQ